MKKSINKKMKKQKGAQNQNLMLFIIPLSLILLSLLLTSLISVVIDLEKRLNFPVITVVFSLCTFLSAFLSANKKRENGLVTGIIYNLPTIILVELFSLILNGFSADLNLLFSFLTMLISSALGGVIGVNQRQKAKRHTR